MSEQPPRWWQRNIGFKPRKRKPVSPLARKINSAISYFLLALVLTFLIWRIPLGFTINHQIAAIHAAGLPANGEELNAWRTVPDAGNGALVMTQAFSLLRTFPDKRSNQFAQVHFLNRTNGWVLQNRHLINQYIQTNASALTKAREALAFSRFRYPVDYSYGPDSMMSHVRPLKTLVSLAALNAVFEAEDNHPDEWPQHLILALDIASTLNQEPTVLGHLVYNSTLALTCSAAERCLNRNVPSDELCKTLQNVFAGMARTNSFSIALIGERAMSLPGFRLNPKEIEKVNRSSYSSSPLPERYKLSGKPSGLTWASGFFERDASFFLKTMDKAISVADLPPPKNLESTNIFAEAGKHAQKKFYLLSGLLMPSLTKVAARDAAAQARTRLATTAFAIERFHRTQDRFPDDLKELVPQFIDAVPLDPFDGNPLRFHPLPNGYVIYSVGEDGHDDGGRERPEPFKTDDKNSYDITFIVQRP